MEESCTLDPEQLARKSEVIAELLKISEEEEIYWQQRVHDKMMKERDNNT